MRDKNPIEDSDNLDESVDTHSTAKVVAGVTAGIVALGAIGWWAFFAGDSGDKHHEAVTTPTAPKPSGTVGGHFDVTSDGVVAGKGGQGLAPDSKTAIGFPNTCNGAVAAISSYLPVLTSDVLPVVKNGKRMAGTAQTGLRETLDYILQGASSSTKQQMMSSAYPDADAAALVDVASGGYRIVSCVPGSKATIATFTCERLAANKTSVSGQICGTQTWDMRFRGNPADWRIRESIVPGVVGPNGSKDTVKGPMTSKKRKSLLSKVEGWREYENAPK